MARRRLETKPAIFCVKSLLLLYSLIFWLSGVLLLCVGLWWRFMLSPYLLLASGPTAAPLALAATGGAIVLFGLFGCFATCRGRPWMLKLYAVFLCLVFIVELVAGISGFVFRHEMKDTFLVSFSDAVTNYDGRDERSLAVDDLQRRLRCCGVHNFTSWSNSRFPSSCCINMRDCKDEDLRDARTAAARVYTQGCYELVTSFIERNMGIIAGVTFSIAFSQLLGVCLACCLSHFIQVNQYEMV